MADEDVAKQYYDSAGDEVADEERDHKAKAGSSKVLMSPKSKGKQQQQALEKLRQRLKNSEEEKASLTEAVEAAKQQTEVVRKKLHNAIRKGKAIEAEKKEQQGELEDLRQRLSNSEKGEREEGKGHAAAAERIASLEDELASAKASVDRWKGQAEETSAKVAQLEAQQEASPQAGAGDGAEAAGELEKEVARLTKENKSLAQKMKLEAAVKEGALKEYSDKLEEKEAANVSLKQEMTALQAAMRSAAERVADATAAESRASEEQETQKGQAKKLQRRIAELEGQLKIAGEQEEDQQRVFHETLNLRKEKDELENEKLHLENDNKAKQELLLQVEEKLESVQQECIRLTHIAEQTKAEAKQELDLKESELVEVRNLADNEVKAALEKEALATEREEKAVESMQEMTQTLQTYRLDEEDRKKKFSRLQGQFSAELEEAKSEIESLNKELQQQQRMVEEYSTKQAEWNRTGTTNSNTSGLEEDQLNSGLQEDQLKSALLAATEPLSQKIDEYRLKAEEAEQQLKSARQKNMELAANLAQMEISASSHLKVEESVGMYKDTIDQAKGREMALQQQVDDLLYERDSLKRANEELIAGDSVASSSEIKLMKEQLEEAQMLKIQAEDSTRKVKQLQKENKDLRWQIAMASPDDSIKVDIPKHLDSKHLQQPKGALALIVKHRKSILIGYLLLLHFTVYFALTHHSHNRTAIHHSPMPNRG